MSEDKSIETNVSKQIVAGQTYGFWTADRCLARGKWWECRCVCGMSKTIRTLSLIKQLSRSCGCKTIAKNKYPKLKSDDVYGYWTLITPHRQNGTAAWACRCVCGVEKSVLAKSIKRGTSLSCGCIQARTRDQKGKRERHVWDSMIRRCTDTHDPQYMNYGGRGIRVCKRWIGSYWNFLEDMGRRPSAQHSIDRADNNAHYSCGKCHECSSNDWTANCRWATWTEQNRNRRNNRHLTHDGKKQTLIAWAEEVGINSETITARISRGWSVSRALTVPVIKQKNNAR